MVRTLEIGLGMYLEVAVCPNILGEMLQLQSKQVAIGGKSGYHPFLNTPGYPHPIIAILSYYLDISKCKT